MDVERHTVAVSGTPVEPDPLGVRPAPPPAGEQGQGAQPGRPSGQRVGIRLRGETNSVDVYIVPPQQDRRGL